jgi:hypothetical protein
MVRVCGAQPEDTSRSSLLEESSTSLASVTWGKCLSRAEAQPFPFSPGSRELGGIKKRAKNVCNSQLRILFISTCRRIGKFQSENLVTPTEAAARVPSDAAGAKPKSKSAQGVGSDILRPQLPAARGRAHSRLKADADADKHARARLRAEILAILRDMGLNPPPTPPHKPKRPHLRVV